VEEHVLQGRVLGGAFEDRDGEPGGEQPGLLGGQAGDFELIWCGEPGLAAVGGDSVLQLGRPGGADPDGLVCSCALFMRLASTRT